MAKGESMALILRGSNSKTRPIAHMLQGFLRSFGGGETAVLPVMSAYGNQLNAQIRRAQRDFLVDAAQSG